MQTAGFVQKATVIPDVAVACFWIGAAPDDAELLYIVRPPSVSDADGAIRNCMVNALLAAATSSRAVVAIRDSNSAEISGLRIDPL